jgi:hypothetical protein
MKKSILAIGLLSLVMILTSFTTPQNNINISTTTTVDHSGQGATGGNVRLDHSGQGATGGNVRLDHSGQGATGGNVRLDHSGQGATGGNVRLD